MTAPEGLRVEALHVARDGRPAVRGASFDVAPGSIALVTGPNGAGKTTLLAAIGGTATAMSGSVRLDGTDLLPLTPRQVARIGVVASPGGRGLFANLTVHDNLRVAARARHLPRREIEPAIERLVERFPVIGARLRTRASRLSGGQQQLVAVGRVALGRPRLVLLDEPSIGLAAATWDAVLQLVRSVADDGATVVVVDQRLEPTLELVDRVWLMRTGVIEEVAARDGARLVELMGGHPPPAASR